MKDEKITSPSSSPLVGGDEGEGGNKILYITLTPTLSRQGRGKVMNFHHSGTI